MIEQAKTFKLKLSIPKLHVNTQSDGRKKLEKIAKFRQCLRNLSFLLTKQLSQINKMAKEIEWYGHNGIQFYFMCVKTRMGLGKTLNIVEITAFTSKS